ncbi:sialate O-acetylesterase [Spirosoma aerophilum]
MKTVFTSLILFLYYFSASGQLIFEQLPNDLQLYPRDVNNEANVVISGKTDTPGYAKIGMQVIREGVLTNVVSQTIDAASNSFPFNLTYAIKAEPAEYTFRVFMYKGADSLLVAEPKRIVCGDVYILYGQSNALALPELDELYSFNFDDKYMRNADYTYEGAKGRVSWFQAKQPFASIGGFGLTLQRLILENYGIPTCVLNGAQGGTGIDALTSRDPSNHANPITFYGNLLNRAQLAGVAKQVKAIIWKQGEAEAGLETAGYDVKFATLYNQLREDYGNARIYVGQINILNVPQDGAAELRDFQRRTKYLFKNVETVATVGTPGYDGIHYSGLANQKLAFEQFRLIARDMYGSKDTVQINSPDIRKTFYNVRKDTITLEFDSQMVWMNDTTFYNFATGEKIAFRELKDFFYLDKQAGLIAGGSASGNRVTLRLKQPASAKTIRYLPAFFSDSASEFYDGPTLKNSRGMRAFTFDNVAIADAIAPVTTLAAKPITENQIQINWTASATAQTQFLERAEDTPTNFRQIAALNGTTNTFTDTNLPNMFGTYYYRLRAYSSISESPYSNTVSARPLVLGVEQIEPIVQLYPNPLSMDRLLSIEANLMTFTQLTLRDVLGRTVKTWRGLAKNKLSIALNELEAGVYIADIQMSEGRSMRRKVVVR